jgi:hypothetical protein
VGVTGGGGAGADHLAAVVDVGGGAGEAAEGAQLAHPAVGPQEGVFWAEAGGDAVADDLAAVVDGAGLAEGELAAERAQVDDLAPGRVRCCRLGRRCWNGDQDPCQQSEHCSGHGGWNVAHGPLPQG